MCQPCYGAPGVGKALSARTTPAGTSWNHAWSAGGATSPPAATKTSGTPCSTPPPSTSPRAVDTLIIDKERDATDGRARRERLRQGRPQPAARQRRVHELLIVDEANRLKMPALEQLRDHYDRSQLGLILIGMLGIEKRLARYPQLYSRVGFVHHYRRRSADEQAFALARYWPHLGLDNPEDFTCAEAVATITRITSGNFRLTSRLVAQIERILEINQLGTVTKEVVEAARESLVIGVLETRPAWNLHQKQQAPAPWHHSNTTAHSSLSDMLPPPTWKAQSEQPAVAR